MQARFLTAVSLGLCVFCASAVTAQARVYDPDGRYSGGQTSRRYELFGGTSYVGSIKRSTVSAPGNYAPGSNEPETIGQAVSSGCFRLLNDDVIDLYDRVKVGAKVIVMR